MGTGDGPVGSNSGRIGEIAPSRSRETFKQKDMSTVGEVEAKTGVLGEDSAGGTPERITAAQDNQIDWETKTAEFKAKIADYQKDRRIQMEEFWNKYVKAAKKGQQIEEPNPEVLSNDIDRWLLQSKRLQSQRQRAKKAGVEVDLPTLPSLEKYNHTTLHKAMADYRTVAEEKAKQKDLEKSGAKLVYDDGDFKTFAITTPAALTKFAQETYWCTKDPETAEDKLEHFNYNVITRNGEPIFAIKFPKSYGGKFEILSRADFEMVGGKDYMVSEGSLKQPLLQEEYQYLKKTLKRLNAPEFDEKYIDVIDEKEKHRRLDAALKGVSENPEFDFISLGTGSISDERIRTAMQKNPAVGAAYIKAAKKRLSRFEDVISQNQDLVLAYANTLSSRFPGEYRQAAEATLLNNAEAALEYAQAYDGRFEAGEEILATDQNTLISYAYMNGGRFPGKHRRLAEDTAAGNIYLALTYANLNGGRFPGDYPEIQKKAELTIAADPHRAALYGSKAINRGRFPNDHPGVREVAEKSIASDSQAAFEYAEQNGGRFPGDNPEIQKQAEYSIAQNLDYALQYAAVNGGRFPGDHEDVLRYVESEIAESPRHILMYTELNGNEFPEDFREKAETTLAKYPKAQAEYKKLLNL
jgi:hypothetical protein